MNDDAQTSATGVIWCWQSTTDDWQQSQDLPSHQASWLHCDRRVDAVRDWLQSSSLPAPAVSALLAEDTRPSCMDHGNGTVLILRGVNHNPDEAPEDMLALRLWIEPGAVISLRSLRIAAPRRVHERIISGWRPANTGALVVRIIAELINDLDPLVETLEDRCDHFETLLLDLDHADPHNELRQLRQRLVELRRWLIPQRGALEQLLQQRPGWLQEAEFKQLRPIAQLLTRRLEDLEALRERALLLQEELGNRIATLAQRRIDALTVITAVCLPLAILTGLLGINVGGMPGADDGNAFWWVCLILALLFVIQVVILRYKRWL